MIYLIWYLISGLIFLSLIFIFSRLDNRKEPKENRELWRLIDRAPRSRKDWIIEKVLVPVIASILAIGFWPLFIVWVIKEKWPRKKKSVTAEEKIFKVETSHLIKRFSIHDIEQQELIFDPLNAVPNIPFGFLNNKWTEFKEKVLPEDEIWSFSAEWIPKWGRKELKDGYVIVQNNTPKKFFIASIKYIV